ncbi:MAG: cytochrome c maturation protein CcmE [Acidimicrobiia bacterium]|nr:cytochrome c maturation protein CcmE [Acidimicrobiia bacterium]MYG60152.1 cytochrome c maturation protein CcmE [Acidimicrobiia bacterium]MYJ32320.1 cytochrome c maturation protein CcmE [Acidimicrobiia bacterium]
MTDTPTEEAVDPGEPMDLSPRPGRPARRGIRRWGPILVVALVAVVIGIVLWRVLADATLVFREVDDAVERREELGDDRFRMIGSPVSGTPQNITLDDGRPAVAFSVTLDGVVADVVHTGAVSDQFQPEVPVVIDGHWVQSRQYARAADDGWYFASDRMLVKHDNDYRVENQDRIDDAEERGQYE